VTVIGVQSHLLDASARHPACPERFCEGSAAQDLSSACGATPLHAKTSLFAFHPAAKTIRREFLAVQRFTFAFPPQSK
jgi:hypothetical protein